MIWAWDEQVIFAIGTFVLKDSDPEVSIHVLGMALECTIAASRAAKRRAALARMGEQLSIARGGRP